MPKDMAHFCSIFTYVAPRNHVPCDMAHPDHPHSSHTHTR